jgi:hypothetical protein
VAIVEGLEPKSPEPKMFAPRADGGPAGRFGGKPFGKPAYGHGGPSKSFGKKPFAPRGEGFAARASETRTPHIGDAPRSPFDRTASVGRVDHKPAGFAPRKPAAPAGKGSFKPQRARPGGFTR